MRNVPIKAAARVRLEIDVTCPDTWGSQCPVEQVHAQARESALRVLHEVFGKHAGADARFSIVGEPRVTAILVETDP